MKIPVIRRKLPTAGITVLLFVLLLVEMSGCSSNRQSQYSPYNQASRNFVQRQNRPNALAGRRLRTKVRVRQNVNEGSLWKNEASFGNLLRDHRARFRGDILSINEVATIASVPPAAQDPAAAGGSQAPTNNVQRANIMLEALTLRNAIEEEQNGILRTLDTMSARVVRVLPDGNMLIHATKVDYRQRNQVRYTTTLTGILRPADVTDTNVVSAKKLASPNLKIRRNVSQSLIRERLWRMAPLIGRQRAGLAGRLSDFTRAGAAPQGNVSAAP